MSHLDIAIVIAFLILTVYIGFIKGRGVKTFKDFAVGTKNYSLPILVSTTAATWFGGWDTMGISEEVYQYGAIIGFAFSLQVFSDMFVARVVGPRMAGHNQGLSLGDMVNPFYGMWGQILISSAALFKTFGNVAIQVAAVGAILQIFLDISFAQGAIIGMSIIIAYTTFGGIRAVIYTDVLQFIFIVVSIPTIVNFLFQSFGGYENFLNQLPATHASFRQSQITPNFLYSVIFAALIPMLNPLVMHRFFLNKNVDLMKKSLTVTALMVVPLFLFVTVIGLSAFILFPGIDPKTAFVTVVTNALPIGIKAIAAIGLISVVMSTADSAVNLNSILFINDIYRPIKSLLSLQPSSEKNLLKLSKAFNLLLGIAATVIALKLKSILTIAITFMAFWTPVAIIPLYGILFRVYVSQRTFVWSVVSGIGSLIIWQQVLSGYAPVVPGFFVGMLSNAVVFFARYWLVDRHNHQLQQEKSAVVPAPKKDLKKPKSFHPLSFLTNTLNPKHLNWAPTAGFAAFVLCIYIAPNFIWQESVTGSTLLTVLKLTGGVLCVGLLLKNYWPRVMARFFPLYWHITIMLTLPFILLLQALLSGFNATSLTNLTLGLFLMALLVPWQTYLILFGIGSIGALTIFTTLCFKGCITFNQDSLLLMTFTFLFAALMAFLFSRPKERKQHQLHQTIKAKAGAFAHDIATPLATLLLGLQRAKKMAESKQQQDLLKSLDQTVQRIMGLKRMNLEDLRSQPADTLFQQPHSLKDLIDQEVSTYPASQRLFKVGQIDPKITLQTNAFSFIAMVQNLFKNAVEAMNATDIENKKHQILISVKAANNALEITITDTGPGMTQEEIDHALNPFYSTKENGTGLGLVNARTVLEKSKYNGNPGTLSLSSSPKKGTSVGLRFSEQCFSPYNHREK